MRNWFQAFSFKFNLYRYTEGVALVACASKHYYNPIMDMSSPIPFELTAACLGLMLVFRTNESYARFVRAHDAWNLVMSRAMEARYITLGACRDPELRALLGRYLLAFPIALKSKYHPRGAIEDGVGSAGSASGDFAHIDGDGDGDVVAGHSGSGAGAGAVAGMRSYRAKTAGGMSPDLARVLRPAEAADMSTRLDKPGHALQVLYIAAGHLGEQEGVRMPTLGRFMVRLYKLNPVDR